MKAKDIKPGHKFIVAGQELYVSYIRYYLSGNMTIDFENLITVNDPYFTNIKTSRDFNLEDEVYEVIE